MSEGNLWVIGPLAGPSLGSILRSGHAKTLREKKQHVTRKRKMSGIAQEHRLNALEELPALLVPNAG